MSKVPKFVWAVLGIVAVAASLHYGGKIAWDMAYPSGTLRYKMTVTVNTPEGLKTGSAVREIYFKSVPQLFPDASPWDAGLIKGEAVVVDLGKRGLLFVLMRGLGGDVDYGHNVLLDAFPGPSDPAYGCCHFTKEGIRYYRSLKAEGATLDIKSYPKFVYFRDMKDPATVKDALDKGTIDGRWDYTIKPDHFEKIFGKGVGIEEVTIEVTDEPVTMVIEKYLPWLKNVTNKLDGEMFTSSNELYHVLNLWDFEKGTR